MTSPSSSSVVPATGGDGPGAGHRPGTARELADRWVETLADLDPAVGTALGIRPGDDRMPDLSPDAAAGRADAARAVLAELAGLGPWGARGEGPDDDDDRRCATLLRERLGAQVALHDAGEEPASLRPIGSPVQGLQSLFLLMPTATDDDWAVVARRMARVGDAAAGYRASLEHGLATGHVSAPRQAAAVVEQLTAWLPTGSSRGWHAGFVARGPQAQRGELDAAAAVACEAVTGLRDWIARTYLPAVAGTPDGVGRDRYRLAARASLGADVDPEEAYAWGWAELDRIEAEMADEAARVLPGASLPEVFAHLDATAHAVDGEPGVQAWLQDLMDTTIDALDGRVVDVPGPVRTVEAMIAPPGAAAAPYYTRPSLDFSRPGRTWLPTLGRTRFPTWNLVSTWYHEGVPGHHLQLGGWAHRADALSRFQMSVGSVSATTEGWALYAERLMDELGHLTDPGARLGYLDGQRLRAVRVVIDLGMHLGLRVPAGRGELSGRTWDPVLGERFLADRSASSPDFVASEVVRYLGWPGQAISYKLGERAWVEGREAARARSAAAGAELDLRAWHTAALRLGSLGLDDLRGELAAL